MHVQKMIKYACIDIRKHPIQQTKIFQTEEGKKVENTQSDSTGIQQRE